MFEKMMASESLDDVAKFAHGVGPNVNGLFTHDYIAKARELKLQVHPYVVRDESLHYTKNPIEENTLYLSSGVDGIFTEHPHLSIASFKDHLKQGFKYDGNQIENESEFMQ